MSDIALSTALALAQGALAWAEEHGSKPLSVVVLDAGGRTKAVLRQDGAGHFGPHIAEAKAASVLGLNVSSSRVLGELFKDRPGLAAAMTGITEGRFLPGAGGQEIRSRDGVLIGAIGASGGTPDQDEGAILAALAQYSQTSDPG